MLKEKAENKNIGLAFTVTPTAATKIKAITEQENKIGYGLRVRMVGGGCGGPKYQLGLDEKADEGDVVVESNGLHVFIDPDSAEWMDQASIDYIEGAMGSGFKVLNPNIESKTTGGGGCGSGGCGSGGCGSGAHEHGDGHDHGEKKSEESGSGGGCGSGGCC